MVEFVIFVIKLTLLQTTHILRHLTHIYQNTHNILSEHTQILQFLTLLAERSRSGT